ncbi:MAG: TetR/AcrR family transcriptional regulator [Muribaculaceae bacterium]|nr:TetR/AcrR family transcriptional regulator [Muribaculaceae bacterium]
MRKEEISEEQFTKIMEEFMSSLMKHGLKATTMDSVAASLQMSKRTLYEIFGSKEELFLEAQKYFHKKIGGRLAQMFNDSSNIMEGIVKCFLFHRDLISRINVEFLRDLEDYSGKGDLLTETHRRQHYENFYDVIKKGVEEGYFREDINLIVQCRMFAIQMEALKRGENLFPEDISLTEILDNVIIGFLRAISSPKGLEELEKYLPKQTISKEKIEN